MEKRFDDLNMQAMAIADNELTNIANTLILSDAENAHITALVLEKTEISANTVKPIVHKRRFGRFGIILAAAVLTIAAMGVTVSGYLRYNQPLVEHHFGVLGNTCLSEMNLPDPVTYSNGVVDLNVEAVLCDGRYAIVLATIEASDEEQQIENILNIDDGSGSVGPNTQATYNIVDNQCWASWIIKIDQKNYGEEIIFRFNDDIMPFEKGVKGIEFPISVSKNVPVVTLKSERGYTMRLSAFQLYTDRPDAFGDCFFRLYRSNGTVTECVMPHISSYSGYSEQENTHVHSTTAKVYEVVDGKEYHKDDPSTYNGFLDLSDVTYIEIEGENYYVQE